MNTDQEQQEVLQQLYNYAANLMFNEKKNFRETRKQLIDEGIEKELANAIVNKLSEEKQSQANKDMLWGAIIFGPFQFFRGVAANSN